LPQYFHEKDSFLYTATIKSRRHLWLLYCTKGKVSTFFAQLPRSFFFYSSLFLQPIPQPSITGSHDDKMEDYATIINKEKFFALAPVETVPGKIFLKKEMAYLLKKKFKLYNYSQLIFFLFANQNNTFLR
jgi:hypothetical protein